MESASNLHQLQDQLLVPSPPPSSSSSLPILPSCFGLANSHGWTPNISLNNTCNYNYPRIFNGGGSGVLTSSLPNRSDCGQKNTNSVLTTSQHLNSSIMLQDLGFQWSTTTTCVNSGTFFTQSSPDLHDQDHPDSQPEKIKEEISSAAQSNFPKFTEMLNNPSCTNQDFDPFSSTNDVKNSNNNTDSHLNDLTHKLLIKTLISSGCQINGGDHDHDQDHIKPGDQFYNTTTSTTNRAAHFAHIYPSINVSNWNLSSPTPASFSDSLDLNLQTPADMLVASGGNFSHSQDNFGIFKETLSDFHDQIHPPPSCLPCIPSKMTPFSTEVTEPKRHCNSIEPTRLNQQSPPLKKSRLDSRASCPPFKVRKEKLGDRIAALQQLVAPFGKTDTASVLMEAIGYIKFLQNQVETLSVPYMKPSCNKTTKPTHRSSMEDGNERQPNRDLRSRGLCLVPLGCLSYVTGDGGGGGGIWPSPGFNGGTS